MTSNAHLVAFIIAAVVVPSIILGAMTAAYFASKRCVRTPRQPADHAEGAAPPESATTPVGALAPLGSSLTAGTLLLAGSGAGGAGRTAALTEEADLWGLDSFPASDPPQNW